MNREEQDIIIPIYLLRTTMCNACEYMEQKPEGTTCKSNNELVGYVAGISTYKCPEGKW